MGVRQAAGSSNTQGKRGGKELPSVLYHEEHHVGFITLNRPEVHNALNREMLGALAELVTVLKRSPPRALVVTGAGDKAFMAGADITELAERDSISGFREVRHRQEVFNALASLPCPSIAAINGYALGAGLELALACTIRVASESAQLGFPEVNLGVIPGDGGTQRLPRIVGLGHALDLILTGKRITAHEAHRIGLVTQVVPSGQALAAATEVARRLAALSPLALALAKEALLGGTGGAPEPGLVMEAALHAVCCTSEEKRQAVSAFLARKSNRKSDH